MLVIVIILMIVVILVLVRVILVLVLLVEVVGLSSGSSLTTVYRVLVGVKGVHAVKELNTYSFTCITISLKLATSV